MRRMVELLEAIARVQFARILKEELSDAKVRTLYELTGVKPIGDLTRRTGFSAGKISGIWQRWETMGLLKKVEGRYRKVL
ncbi:MAG: hypothetical protein ACREX4_15255 [Gammaproteobacteria bacterium]